MCEEQEGQLTWGLIVFSGCVWGEGPQVTDKEFGHLNFPLAQGQECESLLMGFPRSVAIKEKKGLGFKSYQRPNIRNKVRIHYRCSFHVPSPLLCHFQWQIMKQWLGIPFREVEKDGILIGHMISIHISINMSFLVRNIKHMNSFTHLLILMLDSCQVSL